MRYTYKGKRGKQKLKNKFETWFLSSSLGLDATWVMLRRYLDNYVYQSKLIQDIKNCVLSIIIMQPRVQNWIKKSYIRIWGYWFLVTPILLIFLNKMYCVIYFLLGKVLFLYIVCGILLYSNIVYWLNCANSVGQINSIVKHNRKRRHRQRYLINTSLRLKYFIQKLNRHFNLLEVKPNRKWNLRKTNFNDYSFNIPKGVRWYNYLNSSIFFFNANDLSLKHHISYYKNDLVLDPLSKTLDEQKYLIEYLEQTNKMKNVENEFRLKGYIEGKGELSVKKIYPKKYVYNQKDNTQVLLSCYVFCWTNLKKECIPIFALGPWVNDKIIKKPWYVLLDRQVYHEMFNSGLRIGVEVDKIYFTKEQWGNLDDQNIRSVKRREVKLGFRRNLYFIISKIRTFCRIWWKNWGPLIKDWKEYFEIKIIMYFRRKYWKYSTRWYKLVQAVKRKASRYWRAGIFECLCVDFYRNLKKLWKGLIKLCKSVIAKIIRLKKNIIFFWKKGQTGTIDYCIYLFWTWWDEQWRMKKRAKKVFKAIFVATCPPKLYWWWREADDFRSIVLILVYKWLFDLWWFFQYRLFKGLLYKEIIPWIKSIFKWIPRVLSEIIRLIPIVLNFCIYFFPKILKIILSLSKKEIIDLDAQKFTFRHYSLDGNTEMYRYIWSRNVLFRYLYDLFFKGTFVSDIDVIEQKMVIKEEVHTGMTVLKPHQFDSLITKSVRDFTKWPRDYVFDRVCLTGIAEIRLMFHRYLAQEELINTPITPQEFDKMFLIWNKILRLEFLTYISQNWTKDSDVYKYLDYRLAVITKVEDLPWAEFSKDFLIKLLWNDFSKYENIMTTKYLLFLNLFITLEIIYMETLLNDYIQRLHRKKIIKKISIKPKIKICLKPKINFKQKWWLENKNVIYYFDKILK